MQPEFTPPAAPDRSILRWILVAAAAVWLVLCLSATSAGVGFLAGRSGLAEGDDAFGPLYQTWEIIHSKYVDQPVDDTKLIQGAIDGMMQSLGDDNSTYMDPATFESATSSLDGYEGIGATVDITGEYLKIIGIFAGSPAEKAGLKPGDEIIKVDGADMTGKSPSDARDLLLGPAGSSVQLGVRRSGESELLEFDIVRAKIDPPVVESRMLEDGIAYLYLGIFSESAVPQVQEALSDLLEQEPAALILDLRGNIGGYVSSAVEIGSQFLPKGTMLFYEKYGDGREVPYYAKGGGIATGIPMIVLVDGHSASAAEIIAGAIQDHARGRLVGMTTYGKGSVQEWIPLMNDMGAVRITVSLWYTPNGRQISKEGLAPDVEVPITEEEFEAGLDPQLERAIELLR
ncbi:MAG: S41 family peptidase [Anaerolineales bacterium]|nr:S41 family peptidase [Anaerolineales bacterium]